MIPMKNVRNLIEKCEDEAIKNVKIEYKELKKIGIEKYLKENPELKRLLSDGQYHLNKVKVCLEGIHNIVPVSLWIINSQDIREKLFSQDYCGKRFEFLNKLSVDKAQKEYGIRQEYAKLGELITGCKSGVKAKELLEKLGFDVSSLIEAKNVPAPLELSSFNLDLLGVKKN